MITIGQHLKTARENKNFSVKVLSDITRINQRIILNLETDNFSELPKLAYLKCFVRSISNILELEEEYAEKLLIETFGNQTSFHKNIKRSPKAETFRKLYLVDSLVAYGLIKYFFNSFFVKVIFLLVFLTYGLFEAYSYIDNYRTNLSELTIKKSLIAKQKQNNEKKFKIALIASKNSSWITIKIENEKPKHRLLKKGESMSFTANSGKIVLGNPKSTHLFVNGVEIDTILHSKKSGIAKVELFETEPFIRTNIARSLAFEKYR